MDLRKIYLMMFSLFCLNCSDTKKETEEIFSIDSLLNIKEVKEEFKYMTADGLKIFKTLTPQVYDSMFNSEIHLIDEETGQKIDDFTYRIKSDRPKIDNLMVLYGINKGLKLKEMYGFLKPEIDLRELILDSADIKTLLKPWEIKSHVYGTRFDFIGFKDGEYNISILSNEYPIYNFKIDARKENFKKWTTKEKYSKAIDYIKGEQLNYIVKLSKEDPFKNKVVRKY